MRFNDLDVCFTTKDIGVCKEFYEKYFGASTVFDCGWYIIMTFNSGCRECTLSFMNPQPDEPLYMGGATINIHVSDADAEYVRLQSEGLKILKPISDKPWGDRSFVMLDPIGSVLYIHADIEPSAEYKR